MRNAPEQPAGGRAEIDPTEASLRALGRSVAAGVLAGLLVGGLGGRVVMRISAVVANSDGLITEGGNRVGDVTVGGTIALIIFGGGLAGAVGGLILFTIGSWLPRRTSWRALSFALVLPAIAGATIVAAENRDFLILDPPELNIALFLLLFIAFGAVAVVVDDRLDRLLPAPPPSRVKSGRRIESFGVAVPAVFVAFLLLADEKLFEAIFILLVGIVTSVDLAQTPSATNPERSRRSTVLGLGGIAGACLAGTISLISEINLIL